MEAGGDGLREEVRAAYARTVVGGAGILPGKVGDPKHRNELLGYGDTEIPASADLGLGCGNPITTAKLQPGEVVVDLGSGAGMDSFIAAKAVGPSGHVIGVDMTPEMLSKARANAKADGFSNVSFRLGEIEHLPVGDGTADCIISNCVINLSTDKAQVYREMNRVLRPGGRIAISDVLRTADIPQELKTLESFACWVAGASAEDEITDMLKAAGFTDIKLDVKENGREIVASWMPGSSAEKYVTSAYVTATKPTSWGGVRDDPRGQAKAAVPCCAPQPAKAPEPAPAPAKGGGWGPPKPTPAPVKTGGGWGPPKKKPVACWG